MDYINECSNYRTVLSRAAVGDSVLGTVAAMGAVVDRLYRAASRLGY